METMRLSVHPFTLLYPIYITVFYQRLSDLTLWEKLTELYNHFYDIVNMAQNVEHEKQFKKMLEPNAPTISDLEKNMDMIFTILPSIRYRE